MFVVVVSDDAVGGTPCSTVLDSEIEDSFIDDEWIISVYDYYKVVRGGKNSATSILFIMVVVLFFCGSWCARRCGGKKKMQDCRYPRLNSNGACCAKMNGQNCFCVLRQDDDGASPKNVGRTRICRSECTNAGRLRVDTNFLLRKMMILQWEREPLQQFTVLFCL